MKEKLVPRVGKEILEARRVRWHRADTYIEGLDEILDEGYDLSEAERLRYLRLIQVASRISRRSLRALVDPKFDAISDEPIEFF